MKGRIGDRRGDGGGVFRSPIREGFYGFVTMIVASNWSGVITASGSHRTRQATISISRYLLIDQVRIKLPLRELRVRRRRAVQCGSPIRSSMSRSTTSSSAGLSSKASRSKGSSRRSNSMIEAWMSAQSSSTARGDRSSCPSRR